MIHLFLFFLRPSVEQHECSDSRWYYSFNLFLLIICSHSVGAFVTSPLSAILAPHMYSYDYERRPQLRTANTPK